MSKPLKILVACEFSGVVRDAFVALGHDAWSCDLLPTEKPGNHLKCLLEHVLAGAVGPDDFDLMVAFPPCTHLCVSGARWFKDKRGEQKCAVDFFMMIAQAPIRRIAIENPVGIMSTRFRKPDQIIQPWQFGHGETKATCLWLKGLPLLQATHRKNDLFCEPEPAERVARVHREPPGPDRWKNRSRTYSGLARSMAMQWGGLVTGEPTTATK